MRFLTLILFLMIPLSALAQQEQSDRGYIQGLLEDALSAPGRTVRMEGFAGALSSRATIKRVTVTDAKGIWLTASDMVLVWNRAALLSGRIEIDEITIAQIDLPRLPEPAETTLPSPEARGAFSLPELPVSVNIAKMQIAKTVLGAPLFGQPAQVAFSGHATLAAGAGKAALEVKRLDQPGQFSLTGAFDNATRNLGIALTLNEPENGIAVNLLGLPGKPSIGLTIEGDDPIDNFTARIRLATDGQERLAGGVSLVTDAAGATRYGLDLQGDVAPVLVPEFAEFLGSNLHLVANGTRQQDGGVELETLSLQTGALRLQGQAEIGTDGWPRKLALDAVIEPPLGDDVVLPIPGPPLSVQAVTLTGTFDAEEGDTWQIEGRATGLNQGGVSLQSAAFAGTGTIRCEAQSISGRLDMNLDGLDISEPTMARALGRQLRGGFSFGWTNGTPLRMHDIDASGTDYGLTGVATVSGLEGIGALSVVPDVTLAARDLSRFSGLAGLDLSGQAELAVKGQLQPLTGIMTLRFDGTTRELATGIAQLDPLLAGQGKLALNLQRDESGLRADPLQIMTDHAGIDATAFFRTGNSTADLRAQVIDVSRVLPGLTGSAELTAKARQDGKLWTLDAETTLPGETRATYHGTLSGDGVTELSAEGTLSAQVGRLSPFSGLVGRRLSGAAEAAVTGNAELLGGTFDISATGQAQQLDIGVPMIAPLLRETVTFSIASAREEDGNISISSATVTAPGFQANLGGRIGPQLGALDYRFSIANLGVLAPDMPGAASLSGTATRSGQAWQIDAAGQGPGGMSLNATGTAAKDASRVDLNLSGTAPLGLANARLQGQALSGLARFDLAVNGPPALSSVSGRVTVADGRFAAPALNLALNGIRGQADLSAGTAQVSLQADVANGGQVRLDGPVSLSPPYEARLVAGLNNVTLRDAALFEASLSGQVMLDGPLGGGARIGGAIDLHTAELRIPQLGPSYSALEGLKHLNPTHEVRRTLRFAGLDTAQGAAGPLADFPLDLVINAPNRLFVRGRGLDAELGGTLRLTGSTNNVVPVGGLDLIRGRLDLLGRRLVLTEGTMRMRGSFDPVIAFAATSQVEDVSVTLRLEGLASSPELTVTSVPELPQEEALSFFLFGRDVVHISAFQAIQLAAAIRTLSGQGGLGLTEQLRQTLGVDDLDIGTDAEGTTQARVGRYLSENIYTDATVKSDGTSQINLNLELNPNVTVRGRLGNDGDTGIGVFYERDY